MKLFLIFILFFASNFIAWNYFGLFFIVNIIIIFYFLENLKNKKLHYKTLIIFFLLLTLNVSSTFWLYNMNPIHSIMIFIANTLLMFVFFIPNLFIFKKNRFFILKFIITWVLGEYLLSKWDLAWPWLTFGNVMSNQWYLINWYSIVGVYGGSLWILLFSLTLYKILIRKKLNKNITFCILLLLPLVYSMIDYLYELQKPLENDSLKKTEVLCYIPDLKLSESHTQYQKTKKLYKFIQENRSPNLILTPELFYNQLYVNDFKTGNLSYFYNQIFNIKPKTVIFIGTEIHNNPRIKFNGMSVISKDNLFFRTKKKYVPITEFTPSILTPIFGDSYYSMNELDDTSFIKKKNSVFPFVCYESTFSIFFAKNSTNTDFIFLSTSEAFMNKSIFGKKQYLNIIRIRAIETGRYILKCTNDGYSCVINPNGKIDQYLTAEFQTVNITKQKNNTFYQKILTLL